MHTHTHTHPHTHTINVNKTCALQQTTDKSGTKHRLCEIDVNITNGVIFFTHHEQYYIEIHALTFSYRRLTFSKIVFGPPRFQPNIIILPVLFDIPA
jgi:hypothetical protein